MARNPWHPGFLHLFVTCLLPAGHLGGAFCRTMKYRTVWISDLHLGTRHCNAQGLLDFLREVECERLYLVGDIVDVWRLRREHYWPQSHNDVLQKLLRKARKGTRVTFIPGNHDQLLASFLGVYGNVSIKQRDLHITADGRRLLVLHGHEFDTVIQHARWLAYLGDVGYTLLLRINRPVNFLRSLLGGESWSLSAYAKRRVKGAVNFIGKYEHAVVEFARRHRADGIVCGHIHTPAQTSLGGIGYYNCGDWVESSTAMVEHRDGRMELLRWSALAQWLPAAEPAAALTGDALVA